MIRDEADDRKIGPARAGPIAFGRRFRRTANFSERRESCDETGGRGNVPPAPQRGLAKMISSDVGRLARLACAGSLLILVAALGSILVSGAAAAQDDEFSQLPIYREYRDQLAAQGWRPDAEFGLKLASGKPLYRFPEVLCGPKICHARWIRSGTEKIVTLIRGDLTEEYRVSP
jgi:hypothetical protein